MKNTNIYAADFETTVYRGQKKTEVWSSALCPIRTPKMLEKGNVKDPDYDSVIIHHSIDDTMQWLEEQNRDLIMYYHNLKFDGMFWLDYLCRIGYSFYAKQSKKDKDIPVTYSCLISGRGQWYSVTMILKNGHKVQLRDSLKIIPFSLKKAGHDFQTKHQKLEMEYLGNRYAGCRITDEEQKYIANDVLVLAELVEIMYKNDVIDTKTLTIGSACMKKYKTTIPEMYWQENFWRLDMIECPEYVDAKNADEYIRRSYRGGWCYCKGDRAGHVYSTNNRVTYAVTSNNDKIAFVHDCNGATVGIKHGINYIRLTADVNSLYPSMMHSMSGNRYPIGRPHFVQGGSILNYELPKYYSFIHLKCRFKLKKNYLPFIQIKGSAYYKGTEMLEDSRPMMHGRKLNEITMKDGSVIDDMVEMTMTCTDYELFHKHYNVTDETILDGCWFYTDIGMFDDYINYWAEIKQHSKGAVRQIAKLMLNNLYGKFSTSPLNISKIPTYDDETGIIGFDDDVEPDKKTIYIAIGSAITSYARRFTITAAQKNYSSFCYADTDSIHCLCSREQIKGIKVHPTQFCCWKLESFWNGAVFIRQKTYIEVVCCEDEEPIEQQYYNVKCAGMPGNCKDLLIKSFTETKEEAEQNARMAKLIPDDGYPDETRDEMKFLSKRRTMYDFTHGLVIPGKLMPKRFPGGILLTDTTFTMK